MALHGKAKELIQTLLIITMGKAPNLDYTYLRPSGGRNLTKL